MNGGGCFDYGNSETDGAGAIDVINFGTGCWGAGKCPDDLNSGISGGTQQQIRDCDGGAGQTWTHASSGLGTVRVRR